jgi:hypothetical protein
MTTQTQQRVAKARQKVALSYRRQGYRVSVPSKAESLPEFLRDCEPTLVAEREDDRVVVEIKPTEALKGANELVELAERVARQPGWRLELISLGRQEPPELPRGADWLDGMRSLTGDVSVCFYRAALLEMLIRSLALLEGIRVKNRPPLDLVHELGFQGAIDSSLLGRIVAALAWQSDLLHDSTPIRSALEQAAELDALCSAISALQHNSED